MTRRVSVVLSAVFAAGVVGACARSVPASGGRGGPGDPGGAAIARAASSITAASSRQHLAVLADDSMRGRASLRPEIWWSARYIAAQFRAFGLEPLDADGDYIEEFPIHVPQVELSGVVMRVEADGRLLELRCGDDFAVSPAWELPRLGPLVLGRQRDHVWYREHAAEIPDAALVLMPFAPIDSMPDNLRLGSSIEAMVEAGAEGTGVVLPAGSPPDWIRSSARALMQQPLNRFFPPWILLSYETLVRIFDFAGRHAPDLATLGDSLLQLPVVISFDIPMTTRVVRVPTVLARLPGSAPHGTLKDVVITAHFDHDPPDSPSAAADSVYNGSDDNASGTVALIEAARALALLPEPPARSVVFVAVAGEELGLLGSDHLAEAGPATARTTAINLNLDMVSRGPSDSLYVFGQTYSSLGSLFRRVLDAHPELSLHVRPGVQLPDYDLISMSDQFSYLRRGVPVLFFHSGLHPELHTPADEVSLADNDKLARTARLVVYVAHASASDVAEPVWTVDGRARVQLLQRRRMRRARR